MSERPSRGLSLAESGALALAEVAEELDSADDTGKFLKALERNRRVWQALKEVAARQHWLTPDRALAEYAVQTSRSTGHGVHDDHVHALIDINRRVSAQLAGGDDIEQIRRRAYFLWEARGRPQGQDLDHWLMAELETRAGQH
ncbi:MAG: DUF2934 domain-containing protein [Solirubrobacterales bacterium]